MPNSRCEKPIIGVLGGVASDEGHIAACISTNRLKEGMHSVKKRVASPIRGDVS